MDKNWLIRTKSNHILGPVSKEKVLELYHNGSIKPDDEVCSGNGYWFYIREDDLVARFLIGSEAQGFNPISEAKDILTSKAEVLIEEDDHKDDITLVGNLNISLLKKNEEVKVPPVPDALPGHEAEATPLKDARAAEVKKKSSLEKKLKFSSSLPIRPLKKQGWLKYAGIIGFIILLMLIYFRKSIIGHLLDGELSSTISLIDSAHSQEVFPEKKKKLLDSAVALDKITFTPTVGLDGFRVESSLNVEEMECSDLGNEVYQLGVILYPPEQLNENFLKKLRDCVVRLPDSHPVKKWMMSLSVVTPVSEKEQKKVNFLTEMINSQFNLITDLKVKEEIIEVISDIPEVTLPEQILKSYLYVMLGNIARSDNILREIISAPPRVNWERVGKGEGQYHKLARREIKQILTKLSRHPADRMTFQLLCLYLRSYYNDRSLGLMIEGFDTSSVEAKLGLRVIRSLAPSLTSYLRLSSMPEERRMKALRGDSHPLNEQSYWYWPFLDIDPLVSDHMVKELVRLEKEDQLWFIYLLGNEKLSDLFSKRSGRSFLPGRRAYLKEGLKNDKAFMMSLYKLIELGDINPELVNSTTQYLMNE